MAVVYKEYLEIEILRPRRTCTQKEIQQQEKIENSDSESEIETPDNSNDEDFTLERPKKPRKKKKKVPKERREKKVNRVEVPSYQSVMQAQKALEDKLAGRNIINTSNYVYESDDELDEAWTKVYDDDEEDPVPVKQVIEEPPPPEPVKKKKIVIRPWNPQWYQIQH